MKVPGNILRLERKSDVLINREMRIKRVALEDHGDPALAGRKVVDDLAANQNLAGRGNLKAGDHPQKRGLPGTRRSQEYQEFAFVCFQIYVVDRSQFTRFKDFRQISRGNDCHQAPGFYLNLSKIRWYSLCAAAAAFSGVSSPRATLANIVGNTQVVNASSMAAVAN